MTDDDALLGDEGATSEGDTLTPKQAAEACRVSLRTVRRWLSAGELEGAYRDPEGNWHIPHAAIIDRLPAGAAAEETDTRTRVALRVELEHARNELELERTKRIGAERLAEAAERLADAERRRADDLSSALKALMPGPEAPRRRWGRR